MCTYRPHVGDTQELEVKDAMETEDHGESVQELLLDRNSHGLSPIFSSPVLLVPGSVEVSVKMRYDCIVHRRIPSFTVGPSYDVGNFGGDLGICRRDGSIRLHY